MLYHLLHQPNNQETTPEISLISFTIALAFTPFYIYMEPWPGLYMNIFSLSLLFSPDTDEYREAMKKIYEVVKEHEKNMVRAEPEFNKCDLAVQVSVLVVIHSW